jgi:hypothetical protein
MLALTLIQPWATLIVHSGKDVENRSWPTRHRGGLLIHAGRKIDLSGYQQAASYGIVLPEPDELPRGGIIGRVTVTDCVQDSRSRWAEVGQYHWLLDDPVALPFEPCRGLLGLWRYGEDDVPMMALFDEA